MATALALEPTCCIFLLADNFVPCPNVMGIASQCAICPINGFEASGRAVEVAFVIGRLKPSLVPALYVASQSVEGARRRPEHSSWTTRHSGEALLKGITQMAEDLYRTRVQTSIRVDVTAEEAILEEVRSYDLVVLGVTRRSGETLFFGNTVAAALEKSDKSILFLGT